MKSIYKSLLIILAIMAVYYIKQLIGFRLGLNFEEGRDAQAYLSFMQGNLPYRDFEWIYGPFVFFTYPFIMKIFGVNLIVLRISYIIFASLVIPLVFFLARRIMPAYWAAIAAFLSIVFFDVPYYTFNHIFVVLGALASLLMICKFMEEKGFSNLFWAGIFASVVILTKPLMPGLSLFAVISLFLLFKKLGSWRKRIKDYSVFAGATILWPLIYLAYFYSQTKLKNIAVSYPYFARDSVLFIDQLPRIGNSFSLFIKRVIGILPVHRLMDITSFAAFKNIYVNSFENFIFVLPFIVSILIFLIIKWKKPQEGKYLQLFAIFAIFISLEGLVLSHTYGRAYAIQVPFILTVYLLYLAKTIYRHRPLITKALIAIFLFHLSFLHFFRYPYSNVRKYTRPLNLERAGGILVAPAQKELYESLSSYLSGSLEKEDGIAVMGYYPHLSFLSKEKDIFQDDAYIFSNLAMLNGPTEIRGKKLAQEALEEKIISKMEKENPKIILSVNDKQSAGSKDLSPRLDNYIEKKYSLERRLGPANIRGFGEDKCWVNVYKINPVKKAEGQSYPPSKNSKLSDTGILSNGIKERR